MINRNFFLRECYFVIFLLLLNILSTTPSTVALKEITIIPATLQVANEKYWSWLPILNLTSLNAYFPSIVADDFGNVHIIWGGSNVYYMFWNATTGEWSSEEEIPSSDNPGGEITFKSTSFDVDKLGNIHVTWNGNTSETGYNQILYSCRKASTSTWMTSEFVSTESDMSAIAPILKLDNWENVHIIWMDQSNISNNGDDVDIFYKYKNSTTEAWSLTEVVSTESVSGSEAPKLDIDSKGNIHVVWQDISRYVPLEFEKTDDKADELDIFYKYKNITSSIWDITDIPSFILYLEVPDFQDYSGDPTIALDNSDIVHIMWTEVSPVADDFYQRFDIAYNFGSASKTWYLGPVEVFQRDMFFEYSYSNELDYFNPSIIIDNSDSIHVLYSTRNRTTHSKDLMYAYRNASSTSWNITENIEMDTNMDLNINDPFDFAVDLFGNVHVVWKNFTSHSDSIFYRQLTHITSPQLELITPNPSSTGDITLSWNTVTNAIKYHVYRSTSSFDTPSSLSPVATVTDLSFEDSSLEDGTYYYGIVAGSHFLNSTLSNVVFVEVNIAIVAEFVPLTSSTIILIAVLVISRVLIRKRKNEH